MDSLQLRPRSMVLFFWLLGLAVVTLIVGGIVAAIVAGERGSPMHGLWALPGGMLCASYLALYFKSIRYTVDDRYVVKSHGVLWKSRRSVPLDKITNLDVHQGPVARIFGFGEIWVFTPSTGGTTPEERLLGVNDPHGVKATIITRSEEAKLADRTLTDKPDGGKENGVVALLKDIRDVLHKIEDRLGKSQLPGDVIAPSNPRMQTDAAVNGDGGGKE